jgi:hypothetical protein
VIEVFDRIRGTLRSETQVARGNVNRATLMPMVVRLTVFVAGTVAILLAYPVTWWLPALALAPALFPRTFAPTGFIIATSLLWLISTSGGSDRLSTWRLCTVAITLYLVHVGSALAAVLPYDAVYTAGVFQPWLVRAGVVSALTVAVAILITALPRFVTAGQPVMAATIGGVVLMVTTAIFIAYLGYRRQ